MQSLLANRELVSDQAYAAVAANLDSAAPVQLVNQPLVGLRSANLAASSALTQAFAWPAAEQEAQPAPRVWSAYFGMRGRQDSEGSCKGYSTWSNGLLFGLNMDLARLSFGAYAGFSNGKTSTEFADASVASRGCHAGLLARALPLAKLPGLLVTADVSYPHFRNESQRNAGAGVAEAGFGLDVLSAGLRLEYIFGSRHLDFAPFAAARQAGQAQGTVLESGGLTSSRVQKISGRSLLTELGARLSGDFSVSGFRFTPELILAWQRQHADREFFADAAYVWPGGGFTKQFTLKSVQTDQDSLVVGLNLQADRALCGGRQVEMGLAWDPVRGASYSASSLSVFARLRL